MQQELEKEFQLLIKEISTEVMELSVLKAVEKSSYTINKQVPELERIVLDLKNVQQGLKQVNKINVDNQERVDQRSQETLSLLTGINTLAESELQKIQNLEKEIKEFEVKNSSQLKVHSDHFNNLKNENVKLTRKIENLKKMLAEQIEEDIAVNKESKKLLFFALFLSGSSFLAMMALVLESMNVITL